MPLIRYRPFRRWLFVCLMCTCVCVLLLTSHFAPSDDVDVAHHWPLLVDDDAAADVDDEPPSSRPSVPELDWSTISSPSTVRSSSTRRFTIVRDVNRGNSSGPTSNVFIRWEANRRLACDGRFHIYPSFALLSDAIINHDRCLGAGALGGEPISDVLLQNESAEYYTDFNGCFALPACDGIREARIRFSGSKNPLNKWANGLHGGVDVSFEHVEKVFAVAITRFDYANMYFVVNEWYNVYLMARYFGKSPESIRVLLVDAHPRGLLDDAWSVLFGDAMQLSRLPPGRTMFNGGLVWGLMGAGPMSKPTDYRERPPYIDDFHRFVVTRHGLPDPDGRMLDCGDVSVLFVWRHDYVAHPRNPNGTVQRKIANEDELIESIADRHRGAFRIRGLQLDTLPFDEQLRVVGETDVLIGMHGAGLSHVTFMPRHGALIELQPLKARENMHFADLALWRGLIYRNWRNTDVKNEVSKTATRISIDVIDTLLTSSVADMCAQNSTSLRISAFEFHEKAKSETREKQKRLLRSRLQQLHPSQLAHRH